MIAGPLWVTGARSDSLANFMFTTSEKGKDKPGTHVQQRLEVRIPLDPRYPRLPFGRDGQRS